MANDDKRKWLGFLIAAAFLLPACGKRDGGEPARPGTSTRPAASAPAASAPAPAAEPAGVAMSDWDDLPPARGAEGDWPWWRGPRLSNVAPAGQDPPTEWSESTNVLWRVALPGRGHATPCIVGDRIFLPAGDKEAGTIWLLCLARPTGKELWRTPVWQGEMAKIHKDNSYASATPACDGQRVLFPYQTPAAVRLAAMDLEGKILWNVDAAAYKSVQGFSASPALHKSAVIVATDGTKGEGPTRLTALHRKTGEVIWRAGRYDDESYASPLVVNVCGRDQLLIIGPDNTRSYDPDTGALLWQCAGPTKYNAATPAVAGEMVFATGGYPGNALLGIRADGKGDVTATHRVWASDKQAGYVPSPLAHQGLVYAVSDKGLMRCYNAADGAVVWERDLKAPFYSSPVLVGERIYVFDKKGKGYVFAAGRERKLLATNTLPHGAFATPVILGGRIFLRTLGDFYCLGAK